MSDTTLAKDLKKFVQKFDYFSKWTKTKQVDYIAYFLTTIEGRESFKPKDIEDCFDTLDLRKYSRISQYISDSARRKTSKHVKKDSGYRLERSTYDQIKKEAENEPEKVEVSESLEELASNVKGTQEKEFLIEALNCFRVQAYRAFIVMVWILAIDHLKRFIFKEALDEFNIALSKNPDKRVKKIVKLDDFDDLKEAKLIELSRAADVISNDVRKILEEKLGIRNSAAHPSGVGITGHKATELALDLLKNVLLKYKL